MPSRVVVLPPRFDFDGVRQFLDANDLSYASPADEVIIDNGSLQWIEPVGLVCLLAAGRHLLRNCGATRITFARTNPDLLSYLQRMNLFRELGIPEPAVRRRTSAAGRFVELRSVTHGRDVDPIVNEMIQLLPPGGDLKPYAAHCLGELIDNGLQHAGAPSPTVGSAQKSVLTQRGQVAVADCGRGLKRSLEQNPWLTVRHDKEAIDLALAPWTSGNAEADIGMYGGTGNTGNGLSMVRALTESIGGELLLLSGWACLHIKPAGAVTYDVGLWPGTVVAVEFPLELPETFEVLKAAAWKALGPKPRRRRRT